MADPNTRAELATSAEVATAKRTRGSSGVST